MWYIVTPVQSGYDPIVFESDQPTTVVVMNAGPDPIEVLGWSRLKEPTGASDIRMEVRAGGQRMLQAALVRAHLKMGGQFAAVAGRVIGGTTRGDAP